VRYCGKHRDKCPQRAPPLCTVPVRHSDNCNLSEAEIYGAAPFSIDMHRLLHPKRSNPSRRYKKLLCGQKIDYRCYRFFSLSVSIKS